MFKMRKYEMLGFFIIPLISALLLLIFWLIPSNFIIDGIRPTTNSLWQVGKLMFISVLIYSVIEYFIFGREFDNFLFSKAATLFIAPIVFMLSSYVIDILLGGASFNNHLICYILGLALGQYISYYILRVGYNFKLMNAYALFGIVLMMGLYISFGRIVDTFQNPIYRPMEQYQEHIRYQQELMDLI
ncbi:MAG TPA: hypothetical protein GX725_01550 [Mollicutes bacterium]|jgi:hypothetical protein|nr:hypothetical protein [Mollicutes bacterium]